MKRFLMAAVLGAAWLAGSSDAQGFGGGLFKRGSHCGGGCATACNTGCGSATGGCGTAAPGCGGCDTALAMTTMTVTKYRNETQTRKVTVNVSKPVTKEEKYSFTVSEPVTTQEKRTVTECKTVWVDVPYSYNVNKMVTVSEPRQVTECKMVWVDEPYNYTVQVPHTEMKPTTRTWTVCVPKQITEQVPVCRTVRVPVAPACGATTGGCGGCASTCAASCDPCAKSCGGLFRKLFHRHGGSSCGTSHECGYTTQTVTEMVTRCRTVYERENKSETVNVPVTTYTTENKTGTRKVGKQVTEAKTVNVNVAKCVTEVVNATRKVCKQVTENKEITVPVTTCKNVTKEGTRQVTTYENAQVTRDETYTVAVPYQETVQVAASTGCNTGCGHAAPACGITCCHHRGGFLKGLFHRKANCGCASTCGSTCGGCN